MSDAAFIRSGADRWTAIWRHPMAFPALACLAVILARALCAPGVDVSVLITWAERLLDGARPSVDFADTNPPGSYFLYVPSVLLARVLNITPELATEFLVCGLIGCSLWLSWQILKPTRLLDDHDKPILLAGTIAVVGVMPLISFAQREHVGMIAILPLMSLCAATAAGHRSNLWLRLVTGLVAGLALVAKPYFAPLMAGLSLYVVIALRSLRPAFALQWFAAGAVAVAYLLYVKVAYPEFFTTTLPLIADVYVPVRTTFWAMLSMPPLLLALATLAAFHLRVSRSVIGPATIVLGIIAVLGTLLFILQGKGWPYHALPATIALSLVLLWEMTRRSTSAEQAAVATSGQVRWFGKSREFAAVALFVPVLVMDWSHRDHERDIKTIAAIVRQTHPQPRILSIAHDISIGHPLTRMVGGTWVHSMTHLWTAHGVLWQFANLKPDAKRKAHLLALYAGEAKALAVSMAKNKPDIVLVEVGKEAGDDNWLKWARSHPAVSRELDAYVPVRQVDDVLVMARKTGFAGKAPRQSPTH